MPRPNVVAMATRVSPTDCPSFHHTRLIKKFGEKIWGVRGPKLKIEENSFVECHMEN